jgi:hypothetical protein
MRSPDTAIELPNQSRGGYVEDWIKEGKNALRWEKTRAHLSGPSVPSATFTNEIVSHRTVMVLFRSRAPAYSRPGKEIEES